jgi:hypothetical protein
MRRHAGTAVLINRRSATVVPILIALLGIHLSVVGFVPVNSNQFLHDRGTTGVVFSFVAVLASSRWMLRGMHRIVARASRRAAIGLVATIAPYIGGFINLAAFEVIVFTLVFWWLLLFARAIGRPEDAPEPRVPGPAGSVHRTMVVAPPVAVERVAVAARGPLPGPETAFHGPPPPQHPLPATGGPQSDAATARPRAPPARKTRMGACRVTPSLHPRRQSRCVWARRRGCCPIAVQKTLAEDDFHHPVRGDVLLS